MNREPENLLELLGEDAPSDRLRARMEQEIAAEQRRAGRSVKRRQGAWALAAVLLLAVGLGVGLRSSGPPPSFPVAGEGLTSASALQRAQAARSTLNQKVLSESARALLAEMLQSDPDANVRLAVMHALAARRQDVAARESLFKAVAGQERPLIQAQLVRALQRGNEGLSRSELDRLRSIENLDEAARRRLPRS